MIHVEEIQVNIIIFIYLIETQTKMTTKHVETKKINL